MKKNILSLVLLMSVIGGMTRSESTDSTKLMLGRNSGRHL
jgi:hypothetical protein